MSPSSGTPRAATIECLRCGAVRIGSGQSRSEMGDCPRCGYVGWALSRDLTERDRRGLRERLLPADSFAPGL